MIRILLTALLCLGLVGQAHAETDKLRLGVQRGLTYLPWAVMQHGRMVEQQAEKLGLPALQVTYNVFSGGPAMNDALLSESIDVAVTGIPSFLALWAKGRGRLAVKGLASYGAMPIMLVSRNPDVKKITDFTDKDRIATPGVKTSLQSIFLAMAAEKAWGTENAGRFDAITVTRGHPDAMAALLGNTEINAHFAVPPYLQMELKRPDIHVVTTSEEIVGRKPSNGTAYLHVRFYEANPKVTEALYNAMKDAIALINADPKKAAEAYLAVSNEKTPVQEIEAMITLPGTVWSVAPEGTVAIAGFLKRTGIIANAPSDWKELYLPFVWNEPGS